MNKDFTTQPIRPFTTLLIGSCVFLLCWGTLIGYYHSKFDLNIPPSTSGDEPDYDSIAWEISQNRGFASNSRDPEFRRPYDLAAQHEERFLLQQGPYWHTTSRPPLYPYAISFLNRVFGRQFWATRVMDAAFMAGALALLAVVAYRSHGIVAVVISVILFLVVDTRTRLYGRAILTEAMSLFITTLICVSFWRWYKMRKTYNYGGSFYPIVTGLLFGLSLLARTMMITWVPGLLLLIIWINQRQKRPLRYAFLSYLLFLGTATLVFLPWAIRNIQQTGEFMPLGTQGQVQLSAAFGDIIWDTKGEWGNLDGIGFFDSVTSDEQAPLDQELVKAEYSKQKAKEWIIANPLKSIALVPMKLWQECRPRSATDTVIMFLMMIGVWKYWRNPYAQILIAIFLINLMGVAATWSVQGRFLVPVLFPIHIMATLGCYEIFRRFVGIPSIEFNP